MSEKELTLGLFVPAVLRLLYTRDYTWSIATKLNYGLHVRLVLYPPDLQYSFLSLVILPEVIFIKASGTRSVAENLEDSLAEHPYL